METKPRPGEWVPVPNKMDIRTYAAMLQQDMVCKEHDPNGIAPGEPGAKLDSGKPAVFRGLIDYFPRACIEVARISTLGASKYTWKGWESVPDGINRYSDALVRHLCAEAIEGPFDAGPKGLGADVLHASQVAWNALARLELILREQK